MEEHTRRKLAYQVSWVSILVNLFLTVFKLAAGFLAHSYAMVSDAIHSASDVFSTILVMVGVKLSCKVSDSRHPYGHERFECVAAILLAAVLFFTGIGIGYTGIQKMTMAPASLWIPGRLALAAAILSLAVKESLYWYTRHAAICCRSDALMADAWHHRSDALSSLGSFLGILGARLGVPLLDPLASLVICLFILLAAVRIFWEAIRKMTDESCDAGTKKRLEAIVLSQTGVVGIDSLKTRLFGNAVYVEVEIRADGRLPLTAAHAIAEQVHLAMEQACPEVKHCMVHVNPEALGKQSNC